MVSGVAAVSRVWLQTSKMMLVLCVAHCHAPDAVEGVCLVQGWAVSRWACAGDLRWSAERIRGVATAGICGGRQSGFAALLRRRLARHTADSMTVAANLAGRARPGRFAAQQPGHGMARPVGSGAAADRGARYPAAAALGVMRELPRPCAARRERESHRHTK